MKFTNFPAKVKIFEVGARDGLQNEKKILAVKTKAQFIKLLHQSGLKNIEVCSFVREDKIPQMADAVEVYNEVKGLKEAELSCLVPNLKGFEKAKQLGVCEIAIFTSTSDSFNQRNTNSSVSKSFEGSSVKSVS